MTTQEPARVYADDLTTIYCGDATALDLPGETVACAVTSPPYNVGIDYADHDDVMPWDDYRELAAGVCATTYKALIDGGRFWVNVTPVVPVKPIPPGDHSGRGVNPRVSLLHIWTQALLDAGFGIWDYVAWPTHRRPGCAWGSWQSPAGPNMRGEWETIIAAHRGPWARRTPAEWRGWKDTVSEWMPLTTNVWRIHPEHRVVDGHPAPFPEELAARAIRLSSWPGETVLDPFMGSGSTLAAARALARRSIGCDLSQRYCDLAVDRIAQGALDFGGAA